MFICEGCRALARPGVKSFVVVVEQRPKQYPKRKDVYRQRGRDEETRHDHGGVGMEIARTRRVCPACINAER